MSQPSYSIAVLPGEGIGPEVMAAALELLRRLQTRVGRRFAAHEHPAGAQHYLDSGEALPPATLDACRGADAILFGAMGLPHVRAADGTEIIPQLDIRFALDLDAGVRPIRSWPGLPGPLADPRSAQIDLVLLIFTKNMTTDSGLVRYISRTVTGECSHGAKEVERSGKEAAASWANAAGGKDASGIGDCGRGGAADRVHVEEVAR